MFALRWARLARCMCGSGEVPCYTSNRQILARLSAAHPGALAVSVSLRVWAGPIPASPLSATPWPCSKSTAPRLDLCYMRWSTLWHSCTGPALTGTQRWPLWDLEFLADRPERSSGPPPVIRERTGP